MFNTTIHKHESKVVAVTKEIERTISPDKVTDMYDKVRAEVEKDVVRVIRVEGNTLNGVVVQSVNDYSNFQSKIRTRFSINGQEYQSFEIVKGAELYTKEQLLEKLREHYVQEIANYLLRDAMGVVMQLK